MRGLVAIGALSLWIITARDVKAQAVDGNRAGVAAPIVDDSSHERIPAREEPRAARYGARASLRPFAPLASLIFPGAGQAMLGNDRFISYVAVEALAWLQYAKDKREQVAQENAYKDLSRRVARANFTTTFPDADWLYYEWMRDRLESGQYSLTSSGPVVPETNPETYNGIRWLIAQSTQPTPELQLEQYEREAIKPEFRWSWRNAQFQYDVYKRMTDKRNDAARAAVKDLLVIGANHFLSTIDAFATFRFQAQAAQNGRTRIGATVRW